jgi:hypothetical protein
LIIFLFSRWEEEDVMNERKKKGTRWLGLVTALLLLGMLTGLAGQVSPVSAAIPVAMDDFYATVMGKTLVINLPGVLINDTDATVGHTLTAQLVTTTANGTLMLAPDGSFTYTPGLGFIGVDTFTYKAIDNVLNESSPATVQITVLDDYGAVWGCTIDEGGPNDEVAQGDLTRMCTDLNPANAAYTNIKWNWDVVYGTKVAAPALTLAHCSISMTIQALIMPCVSKHGPTPV